MLIFKKGNLLIDHIFLFRHILIIFEVWVDVCTLHKIISTKFKLLYIKVKKKYYIFLHKIKVILLQIADAIKNTLLGS